MASHADKTGLGRAALPDRKGSYRCRMHFWSDYQPRSRSARELDVIANNIANLNTTGFKSDGAVFEEFISPTARADNFLAADRRVSFVQDRATWIDHSQGPLERTGNPLDVAIDGRGFLVVQTPAGERYTRNGGDADQQ